MIKLIICTILFASDGALHIVRLSFLKSFLITVTIIWILCSFRIQVRKLNGNSVQSQLLNVKKSRCNCERCANCWPDPATQCARHLPAWILPLISGEQNCMFTPAFRNMAGIWCTQPQILPRELGQNFPWTIWIFFSILSISMFSHIHLLWV